MHKNITWSVFSKIQNLHCQRYHPWQHIKIHKQEMWPISKDSDGLSHSWVMKEFRWVIIASETIRKCFLFGHLKKVDFNGRRNLSDKLFFRKERENQIRLEISGVENQPRSNLNRNRYLNHQTFDRVYTYHIFYTSWSIMKMFIINKWEKYVWIEFIFRK